MSFVGNLEKVINAKQKNNMFEDCCAVKNHCPESEIRLDLDAI